MDAAVICHIFCSYFLMLLATILSYLFIIIFIHSFPPLYIIISFVYISVVYFNLL
ncbi:hypothetical protein LINPERHAP1_LOCUS17955, partial [Linum perenne]